jgi:hypothetical protein
MLGDDRPGSWWAAVLAILSVGGTMAVLYLPLALK